MLLDVVSSKVEEINSKGLTGQQVIDQSKQAVANIPGIIVEISEQEGGLHLKIPLKLVFLEILKMRLLE